MNITITNDALDKLREYREEDSPYIRMAVLPGGCSGFQYSLNMESKIEDDDYVYEASSDISILIDPFSEQYLEGVTLDFHSSMMGSGFVFENPNASGGCGCGSSFTV